MNKQKIVIIPWMIFGFVLITAVNAILYFFAHAIFFLAFELEIIIDLITYAVPIITFTAYVAAAFFIIKKFEANSISWNLIKFPKRTFIIAAIVAIFLYPLTNKLFGQASGRIAGNLIYNVSDFFSAYGWMKMGIDTSQWIILLFLVIFFLKKISTVEYT